MKEDTYQRISLGGLVAHLADFPDVVARRVNGKGIPLVDHHDDTLVTQLVDLPRLDPMMG
jgi:hypothetical protein